MPRSKKSAADAIKGAAAVAETMKDHGVKPGTIDYSKKGKASKVKGASYERAVADKFKAYFPAAARGIGQMRSSGEVPDVTYVPGWWIEAKRRKGYVNLVAAIKQAETALLDYLTRMTVTRMVPLYERVVVISKSDRERDMATMPLDAFIKYVVEYEALRRENAELKKQLQVLTK